MSDYNIASTSTSVSSPLPTDDMHASPINENQIAALELISDRLTEAKQEISHVIFGQEQVIDQALISLLSGGHALLVGVPGLGKTLMVETIGQVLGLSEKRVQFTPDLMPADILGSEVLEESNNPSHMGQRHFRFIEGPVFSQLLMADEINRASPRTQSALLQAMQEKRVSVAGQYRPLPQPFHVLATQNPLEQEGTYPLPEAQLDRFLMEIHIQYPDKEIEREIILKTTGQQNHTIQKIITAEELIQAQQLIRHVPVGEDVLNAILHIVRHARPEQSELEIVREHVAWGPGPRASQAFMQAVRARAVLDHRFAPSVDDVLALCKPILRHRMSMGFSAFGAEITQDHIFTALCDPLR